MPKPLPVATATPVPAGWSAAFAALRLPPSASVLVVPVPMFTFTEPLRWQADTGEPRSLVGGYFMGPGPHGKGYIDGNGTPRAGLYLNAMWVFSQAGPPQAAGGRAPNARPNATGYLPVHTRVYTFADDKVYVKLTAVADKKTLFGYIDGFMYQKDKIDRSAFNRDGICVELRHF